MYQVPFLTPSYLGGREEARFCDSGGKVSRLATFRLPTAHSVSVNLTPDGKQALLKLSKGDMRRALNVLQACHAAFDVIGETEIYNCTGNPHPSDIEKIVNSMLSDEFTTSYQSKRHRGSNSTVVDQSQ